MAAEEASGRAVEVLGVPPELPDLLLLLYFENRRRSGGGPVQSCRRRGCRAVLTFEAADDAQRVLSRSDHVLQDSRLAVQPAAPRDPKKVLLRGLDPQTDLEMLELYVEHMLNCERGGYSIHRSRAGDQVLVQLPEPLSHAEFLALAERVQSRPLDGASLALDWLEQTNSLLVCSRDSSQLKADLLELYFESKRSSGGQVLAVRPLQGGKMAVVSFQDHAVAERVLHRPHQLADSNLDVYPYYDFLQPEEQEEETEETGGGGSAPPADDRVPQTWVPVPDAATQQLLQSERVLRELEAAVPGCVLQLDRAGLQISGGDPASRRQLQKHVQAALQKVEREQLPFTAWVLGFLQREDVRTCLAQRLDEQGLGACYVPTEQEVLVVALGPSLARQAASLLSSCLSSITLPLSERQLLALTSPRWDQARAALTCCLVRLAESGEALEGLTLTGLEQENTARLEAFLQDSAPDEALVAMEPGALRYLQHYYQELLAGIAHVTLLPLEGTDVTGLRLSGEAQACQAASELLHSLLGAIHSQAVTLALPGVDRFLLDQRGQAVVQALEKRFCCTVGLEKVCWRPSESQHELEISQEPLALSCRRDSPHGSRSPGGPGGGAGKQREASTEEIKGLLAALQPPAVPDTEAGPAAHGEEEGDSLVPAPVADAAGSSEAGAIEEGALPHPGGVTGAGRAEEEEEEEEEQAQLLLAIQQSMDAARREEDELQRATELSLRSWEQEQAHGPDAALLSAMSLSLRDVEQAGGSTQVVVYAAPEVDVEALSWELEAALRAQLREEVVHSKALQSLPPLGLDYLNHLERKHAVQILVDGSVATVRGFADYPVAATRDLALLLTRLLRAEEGRDPADAHWVHWDAHGNSSPTPYSAEASALLEQAWRQGHKRLDVFFDGRPFAIDFERMEEYDLSSARAVPIGRQEAPLLPSLQGGPGSLTALEDAVKLVLLAEGSQEFQETVRHFYQTLEDFHSKIRIVKVEKLLHPLLYQQYQLKKAAMEKACGHQRVERILFHGTTEQACREICQHGFNRSFCGKNATRYGHGVYFAGKAFISVQDQYSPCGRDGDKYIFVTRTLTGDFTAGNQSMRVPPLRPGSAELQRYDSTVDDPCDPTIFVIFNDTQAYPQYLITCRWSKPH